ncbi:23S rRNA (adenine(2503)-C(2))-methyltransferase RlmN [Robiginitomaculum antarcticum]|uniref:23S rRNA (adenine(2503)-C(2))-methyltransferase RlmN n=1 Tax=Robiginitomaculum antarcticum TaxID=437507 RepID=UPI00036F4B88|nr:23S rRNA (adenine(2503)-C(2))-methyltransferase RlmN [Robiginitomaculum antarcticum]
MATELLNKTPEVPDLLPRALRDGEGRIMLAGLGRDELAQALASIGIEPKKIRMRVKQVFHWIYNYGVTDWDAMTNIAKPLRETFAGAFSLARPEIVERLISKDGTRKYLIRMAPGIEVESVFIPDVSKTGALCVSSQVGCTLTCTFCHTGTQRLVRNLTAQEIVLQVIAARDDLDEWPTTQDVRKLTNIVFMGMGEPLYNTDEVGDSLDIICDPEGLGIGRRRITVSTSGVVPQIVPMGARTNAMLAISLHAANDELRTQIMPINNKYPLAELMQACRDYPGLSNSKRITFEYVMLKGINDSPKHARELINLLRGIPAKVNLIPFNPWPGTDYVCSDWSTIERFSDMVNAAGYASPIRTPRGRDIFAACGQLKSDSEKKRASTIRKEKLAASQIALQ